MNYTESILKKALFCFIFVNFLSCNLRREKCIYGIGYKFEDALEVDNSFIVEEKDQTVYFSKNVNGKYSLMSYDIESGKIKKRFNLRQNLTHPFLYGDEVAGLEEDGVSGKRKIFKHSTLGNFSSNYIDKIYPSKGGRFVIAKYLEDSSLYLFNSKNHRKATLKRLSDPLNGAFISEKNNICLISVGDSLIIIDLVKNKEKAIAESIKGKKLNPFMYGSTIYFSASDSSDNFRIYKVDIKDKNRNVPQLVLSSENDLRLPKRDEKNLYYIEIVNSEYLLKYISLKSGEIRSVSGKGIVYDYEITKRKIIFTYSDLLTPRCLTFYDKVLGKVIKIENHEFNLFINTLFIRKSNQNSPAYILQSRLKIKPKGVILYFHPGKRNDDYSPRWDNMLMPLCFNGYIVIAPNYPTSTGYGKAFEQSDYIEAIRDMNNWKKKISDKFPKLPIFFYGTSSGCILMEACLKYDPKNVKAAISSFGLSYYDYKVVEVPTCFVLGRKDPVVNYHTRSESLSKQNNKHINIVTLENEGHWIQNPGNFYLYYNKIFNFLDQN